MQVVLVMFRSDGERRSFSVTRDVTVIGRREDCDLRIPLSEVSRKHCRFIKDGDSIRIEDLGSSNGTYHNGQRVQEAILSPGDTIQIGPVLFCIQIDGVPAEEEMAPIYHSAEEPAYDEATAGAMAEMSTEAVASGGIEEELETLPEEAVAEEELETLPEEGTEEQLETLSEEPVAEEELTPFEEAPAALEEEPLTLEEEPLAMEEEPLEMLEEETPAAAPAAAAAEEPLSLEDEPLAEEEAAPAAATPPPVPAAPSPVAEAGEEDLLGLEEITVEEPIAFEEPAPAEEELISLEEETGEEVVLQDDDVVEDFEIIDHESEEEVDSKNKK